MAFRARYIGNTNTNYPLVNGNEYDIILLNSDVYFEIIQFHVINTGYDFQMESNNLYPINEIEQTNMIEDRLRIKSEMEYHRNVNKVICISDDISILKKGNVYDVEEYRNHFGHNYLINAAWYYWDSFKPLNEYRKERIKNILDICLK